MALTGVAYCKQCVVCLVEAICGICFFMFYLLPWSAWRQVTSGKDAIDARLKSARDSLKMLTEEAVNQVKEKCDEPYKDTVKSVQFNLDISQHCVVGGDPDKSTSMVLLLHGFPECWYTWNAVIPQLVNKGHFVVAPDMRGYGLTDSPMDVASYTMPKLADDFRTLIRHVRHELVPKIQKVTVVAHDWGGGPANELALTEPDVIDGCVLINIPHFKVIESKEFWKQAPWQLFRSWYIFMIQVPGLFEFIQRGVPILSKVNPHHSKFGHKLIRAALAKNVTQVLNYYRTSYLNISLSNTLHSVWKFGPFSSKAYASPEKHTLTKAHGIAMRVPLMQIWGTGDTRLDVALPEFLEKYGERYAPKGCEVIYLDGVDHWTPSVKPTEVASNVHRFIEEVVGK